MLPVRKKWTTEEDEEIQSYVTRNNGPGNWESVMVRLPGRSEGAIRSRWRHLTRT